MAPQSTMSYPAFVYGQGADLQSLNALAMGIAGTSIPVLLVGESGSGKDFYARLIHRLSGADERSFVRVNCGAADAIQLLSEVRRAFQRGGDGFERNSGTVFLDGVHELDAVCQRLILSLLPEGDTGKEVLHNSPRIISSTSSNFEKEIESGRFRLELYFRINGAILRLPPLRQRKEDIPDLLECFIAKHSKELKKDPPEVDREARKLLFAYDWPGNLRELENVARNIVAVEDAALALNDLRATTFSSPVRLESMTITPLKVAARAASRSTERELILKALEHTNWNRKRAAQNLQISYKSLLYKIKQIGAEVPLTGKQEGRS
jgi:two-component system response regulator AtoC